MTNSRETMRRRWWLMQVHRPQLGMLSGSITGTALLGMFIERTSMETNIISGVIYCMLLAFGLGVIFEALERVIVPSRECVVEGLEAFWCSGGP